MFNSSSRKAAALALSLGGALWLCVAGTAVADAAGSDSVSAEAEQVESAAKSGDPVAETEDEKALLERAREFWDLRVARDAKVYEFYPPEAREGGAVPNLLGAVFHKEVEIERVLTKGDRGVVVVRTQRVLSPSLGNKVPEKFEKQLRMPISEEWVRVDGTWYKQPVKPGLSQYMRRRDDPGSAPAESETPQGVGGEVPGSAGP